MTAEPVPEDAAPGGDPIAERPGNPDTSLARMTVEELAARTGTTVRTVRFYASEGLLPPPTRHGRIAYYDARHRLRLDLVRTMQEHGFTLAAIERVLARIPADAPAAVYAVQAAALAPWLPAGPTEVLDRAALDRRAGHRLSDAELDYLSAVGALERVDAEHMRVASGVLGHAVELLRLPVPRAVLHESTAIIDRHATAVADGLTELFVRAVWGPYQRGELDSEQVVALLERLRPLAVQGLVSAFTRAADRAARRGLDGSGSGSSEPA